MSHKQLKAVSSYARTPGLQPCLPCGLFFLVPLLPCAFWLKLGLAVEPLLLPDFLFVVSLFACRNLDPQFRAYSLLLTRISLYLSTLNNPTGTIRPTQHLTKSKRAPFTMGFGTPSLFPPLEGPSQIYSSPNPTKKLRSHPSARG